jgi:hypothetical protein
MGIKALIADVESFDRQQNEDSQPGKDYIPLLVPMPTYRALSDAAARRGWTVSQLLGYAFKIALEEHSNGRD